MGYTETMNAFYRYGQEAICKVIAENSALFLSLDESKVAELMVSTVRLQALELPMPRDEGQCYEQLLTVVGNLLKGGKVDLKPYGLSVAGRNQYHALINRVSPPAPSTDPAVIYADVVALHAGPKNLFDDRWRTDERFRTRAYEATALGLI
jgi:hypothetical protein